MVLVQRDHILPAEASDPAFRGSISLGRLDVLRIGSRPVACVKAMTSRWRRREGSSGSSALLVDTSCIKQVRRYLF